MKVSVAYVPLLCLTFILNNLQAAAEEKCNIKLQPPKLVVVIVIDQFAHHYLPKLNPFFTDGFKELQTHGMCYENAHYPHGAPSTAPGHATLSTGTVPRHHGVVLNSWVNEHGEKIVFGNDDRPESALFHQSTGSSSGKSSCQLLVDTLSDKLMLASCTEKTNTAYALSYKARAAIAMAGRCGKAIWFDSKAKSFTSSKAYFDQFPQWVDVWNKKNTINTTSIQWPLRFKRNGPAYAFDWIDDYSYASRQQKLAGRTINFTPKLSQGSQQASNDDDDFEDTNAIATFLRTPTANRYLLDMAQECLKHNFHEASGTFLLWVSLSSLDMLAHEYGPYARETIDMIYHLDTQLGDFMRFCKNQAGANNTMFILTADHGVAPISELVQKQGYDAARRIHVKPLIAAMNKYIEKKFNIAKAVKHFKANQFYLDNALGEHKNSVLKKLKKFLEKQQGIRHVWTKDELLTHYYHADDLEQLFKNQAHPSRTGDLICMTHPYCALATHTTGATHRSPYDYDTHVPLIVYQQGVYTQSLFEQKIYMSQVAGTLAEIMKIPRPSASIAQLLPGFE